MKYLKDTAKLTEVINILASHIAEAEQFHLAQLSIQISKEDDSLEKIANLFVIANR